MRGTGFHEKRLGFCRECGRVKSCSLLHSAVDLNPKPSWMQNLSHGWLCSPEVVGSCSPCNCHSWQEGQGNADFLLTSSVCHHMCLFDIHLASHFYCCTKSLNEFINKQTVNAGCCFNVKLEFRSTLGIETTNELIVIYISY